MLAEGFLPGWSDDDSLWLRFFDQACDLIAPRAMPSADDRSEAMEPTTLSSVVARAMRLHEAVIARKDEAC